MITLGTKNQEILGPPVYYITYINLKIIRPSSIPHKYRFPTMGQDSGQCSVQLIRGPWSNSKGDQITIAKFSPLSVSLYFQN